MNRILWGSSQALSSVLYFLIQLSFLKLDNLKIMAEFSILFGLMNFFLLLIRRSLIEINDFSEHLPATTLVLACIFCFFIFTFPISMKFQGQSSVHIGISLFLLNQIILDVLRFASSKGHKFFFLVQSTSILFVVIAGFFNFTALEIFSKLIMLQFFAYLLYALFVRQKKLSLAQTFALTSWTRIADFSLSSSFGFFLPFITLILLGDKFVGILRTSQNFLSIGSIFTFAFYYSRLKSESSKETSAWSYLFPSLSLLLVFSSLKFLAPKALVFKVFGPYFYESGSLTLFLIVALVPSMLAANQNAQLVNQREFGSLLRIHFFSSLFLALGSCIGFYFLGIISFGIFSLLSSCFEAYFIKKVLNGNKS